MTGWISTKQAMQILGVGSTTIKRWADAGTLASHRTVGGHRRFRVDEVNRLLQQQPATVKNTMIDQWVELLTEERDVMRIRSEISQLRDRLGDWYRTADFLERVMRGIWSRFSEDDESDSWGLIATDRLGLVLSHLSRSIAVEPAEPLGLVASIGDRELSHSLSLIQLCARSDGIQLVRADAMTPVKDLISQIQNWNQRLLVLCGAGQCADDDLLVRAYREISAACQEEDVELVIGLGDFTPDIGDYGHRCHSFEDLKLILTKLRPVLEAAPETRN